MAIIFFPKEHVYKSIDPNEKIEWKSVTSIIKTYKRPFSPDQAKKSSKNKKSKWYKLTPEKIEEIWKEERDRSTNLGDWYHRKLEHQVINKETLEVNGVKLYVIKPINNELGDKIAPIQKLISGHIYPEHFMYLKSAGICGQSDKVIVENNEVSIGDYKTSKEIKRESFKNWEGISAKMLNPFNHLDDCEINHYALQLSLYMYMIIKHNPNLTPKELFVEHITFEKEGETEYGYPILKLHNGEPIIKGIEKISLPYLKGEVQTIIKLITNGK